MSDQKRQPKKKIPIPPSHKSARFWQFKKLPHYAEIHDRIVAGQYLKEITEYMQKELKVFLHLTPKSLREYLQDYKATIPKAEFLQRASPLFIAQIKKSAGKQLNVLNEFTNLYEIQMKRIERSLDHEDTIGMNLKDMEVSVKTAQGLLEAIHTVQTDLGLTPKHLGTMDINANVMQDITHKYANDSVSKVLENPTSRHKVLSVAERILALAADTKIDDVTKAKNANQIANLLDSTQPPIIDFDDYNEIKEKIEQNAAA